MSPPSPSPISNRPPSAKKNHRILFLQNSSLFEGYGGIEYYHDDFLTLASEIYSPASVHALIPQRTDNPEILERPYRMTLVKYASNRWLQKLENRLPLNFTQAAFQIVAKMKPTLIIAGHVALGPIAMALHLRKKIPYLVNVHGIEVWGKMWPQDQLALKKAHGILPTSHWTKRILVDKGFPEARIKVIQPRLPTAYEKFPPPRRPRPVGQPFTLLTISRLDAREQYKGQDHVLQALFRLRQTDPDIPWRYLIQGDGTDRPRLEALTKELGLEELVEFRPAVRDRMEFENVYRQADLFVMPSRFGLLEGKWRGEGFGLVYLEAAAFGLPSLAYDCGGATDFIRHGENGMLVEQDNIAELANSIHHLATNPKLHFEISKKAHETVMSQFTRLPIRKQIIDALDAF